MANNTTITLLLSTHYSIYLLTYLVLYYFLQSNYLRKHRLVTLLRFQLVRPNVAYLDFSLHMIIILVSMYVRIRKAFHSGIISRFDAYCQEVFFIYYSHRISNIKLIFYNAINCLPIEYITGLIVNALHHVFHNFFITRKKSQVKKNQCLLSICLQSGRVRFRVRYPLWSRYQMTKHSVVVLSSKETAKLTPWLTGHSFSCSIVVIIIFYCCDRVDECFFNLF